MVRNTAELRIEMMSKFLRGATDCIFKAHTGAVVGSSSTDTFSPRGAFLFTCCILLLYLPVSMAENVNEDQEDDQEEDVFEDDDYYSFRKKAPGDEWYMVLLFSLLFGFIITLFGAVVGYFSVLEDSLMRRYKAEGTTIFADVTSSEFARGGGKVAIFTKQRDNPEYIAFCEYNCCLAKDYTVRIRKQVKAKQSDFSSNPRPGTEGMLLSIRLAVSRDAPDMYTELATPDDPCCGGNEIEDPWNEGPLRDDEERRYLELLILPGHEKSAYPRKQVERAGSMRYRLSTIGLVVFDLALAAFCTLLAANDVLALEHDGQKIIGWYAIATFFIFFLCEVPLIHYWCHESFLDALKEEYLENGEYVPMPDDCSSLSSGSDMYLSPRVYASQK